MQKVRSITNFKGFSLTEVVLSVALFGLLVTAFIGAYLYGQESSVLAGQRVRAAMLAEEGLEAVRNIRDAGFNNLANGTYGLATTSNQWSLSGSSDTQGAFTRTVSIQRIGTKRLYATSTVTWQQSLQRTGSITVATEFTNWQSVQPTQALDLFINTAASATQGDFINGTTIQNNDTVGVTIASIVVTWHDVSPTTRIQDVLINGTSVWTGNGKSGDVLDIIDTTIAGESAAIPISLDFKKNVSGATFTLSLTMTDGSSTTTSPVSL